MPCKNHPEVVENLVRCSRCGEKYCPDCVVELSAAPFCKSCKDEKVLDVMSGAERAGPVPLGIPLGMFSTDIFELAGRLWAWIRGVFR